ncbi:hypothetical protein L484_023643 [Morus notabilis]|uniref:Uncharacterized protein n=1 Tax=Morus notabilis TaxID=981085 RepID=W9RGV4_9ROSA|nr:hypothetical protein L484_023643 [Morus notabilis]
MNLVREGQIGEFPDRICHGARRWGTSSICDRDRDLLRRLVRASALSSICDLRLLATKAVPQQFPGDAIHRERGESTLLCSFALPEMMEVFT